LGHTPVKENDHQNLHDPFEAAGVRYQCHQLVESGKAGCDVLFNMQTENSGVMHKLKYGFHVIYAHIGSALQLIKQTTILRQLHLKSNSNANVHNKQR